MNPLIFDADDGVVLEIPLTNGINITVHMKDEVAQEMVNIIQNKLNARIK